MDTVAIIFYGLVCGALGALAPALGSRAARIAIGAGIGVIAALVLPLLRNMMGY